MCKSEAFGPIQTVKASACGMCRMSADNNSCTSLKRTCKGEPCNLDPLKKKLKIGVATTALLQQARGQPPAKRVRRQTVRLQERLHTLCTRYKDGAVDTASFLRGIVHIRLS